MATNRNRRDHDQYAKEMGEWAEQWDTAFEAAEQQRRARTPMLQPTVSSTAAILPVPQQREIETKHAGVVTRFQRRAKELAERPLSVVTTALAQELDNDAKSWLLAFETETAPTRTALHQAHKAFCDFCVKMSLPASQARTIARNIIGAWDIEQRRQTAAQRLEAERIAREQAEALRKAEVDARIAEAVQYEITDPAMAEAIVQEAGALEQAPLAVVSAPVAAPPKLPGHSVQYRYIGEINDLPALLRWIVEGARWDIHRELFGEPGKSGMTALLTRHCSEGPGGTIIGVPPGITATLDAIPINRGK